MALRQGSRVGPGAVVDVRAMAAAVGVAIAVATPLLLAGHARFSSPRAAAAGFPTSPSSRTAVRVGAQAAVVVNGVSYSVLGIQLRGSVAGSGVSLPKDREFAIVKVRVRNGSGVPARASLGFVTLAAGARDYQPRVDVAARLASTYWRALYLKRLASGGVTHVKVFFVVPTNLSSAIALRIGSHSAGAHAGLIPLFLP